MTKIEPRPLRCGVCGYETEQFVLLSTSTFGHPDLDTRPAELARSTLSFSVETCPRCGYCAESIEEGGVEPELLESARYLRPLEADGLPDVALRLLRAAVVAEAKGDAARAGWAA
ncbi:MAG: hypothetical protein M3321_12240, partial [Actinomycetota bacterium]|nr:hypothetical protein [Actinomycetota bacterium]